MKSQIIVLRISVYTLETTWGGFWKLVQSRSGSGMSWGVLHRTSTLRTSVRWWLLPWAAQLIQATMQVLEGSSYESIFRREIWAGKGGKWTLCHTDTVPKERRGISPLSPSVCCLDPLLHPADPAAAVRCAQISCPFNSISSAHREASQSQCLWGGEETFVSSPGSQFIRILLGLPVKCVFVLMWFCPWDHVVGVRWSVSLLLLVGL